MLVLLITDDVREFLPNGNYTFVARNIGSTTIGDFNSKVSGSGGSNLANKIEPNYAISNVGASNSMNATDDVRAFLPSGNSILVSRNIGSTAISDFSSKASVSGGSNMANKIETNHVRRFF
ncbi:hypothetical protein ACH5RR_040801 [Cinchona calisaya]|uniref:Uncharacterized protein n=1 Tax=Cinchona calisaya TaxID=153742 RepID=A0ABD2XUZ5_9GENT